MADYSTFGNSDFNYMPNKKETINTNKPKSKKSKTIGIALLLTMLFTMGPGVKRNIKEYNDSKDKKYELNEMNEMYKIIVQYIKKSGLNNSISITKYISNLILNGYLTIENTVDKNYNMTDNYSYDGIISGFTDLSGSDAIVSLLNMIYEEGQVKAYLVKPNIKDKIENKETSEYAVLVCDKQLNIVYLYSIKYDRFINLNGLSAFNTNNISGSILPLELYANGTYNIIDLIDLMANTNGNFSSINYDVYSNQGDNAFNKDVESKTDLSKRILVHQVHITCSEKDYNDK